MQSLALTIADDHVLFTETLGEVLAVQADVPVYIMDIVHSGNALIKVLNSRVPDILLLDLNMPDGDGLSVMPQIRKSYKEIKIIVLTMYDDPKFIKEVLQGGAYGYVLKTSGLKELLLAMQMAINNKTYLSEGLQIFPKDFESHEQQAYNDDFQIKYRLTKRETEILTLISQAKSNKEIADELFISDQTVGVHRKNIMRKLSVSSTAGLIKFAMDNINQ